MPSWTAKIQSSQVVLEAALANLFTWDIHNVRIDRTLKQVAQETRNHLKTVSVLCIPMTAPGQGEPFAVLKCLNKLGDNGAVKPFDSNDVTLSTFFARKLASAVQMDV